MQEVEKIEKMNQIGKRSSRIMLLKAIGFLVLTISGVSLITSCSNSSSTDITAYNENQNSPDIVKALSCLKDDGYEFGSDMMKKYLLPSSLEKVANQDFYLLSYKDHNQLNNVRERMVKKFPNEAPVSDSLLSLVQDIKAVHVAKQFGSAWKYEHANIKIEEWSYKDGSQAIAAKNELQRVFSFDLHEDRCLLFTRDSCVYLFYIWETSKKSELKTVADKVMQEIDSYNR